MRGRVNHLYKQHLLRMTSMKCYGLSEWLLRLIDKCLKQWISMSMIIGCHAQTPKSLSPYRHDVHFVIWLHFPVPAVLPPWEQYLKSLPFCVRNFRIRIWEYLGYFLMYYCPCWSVGMKTYCTIKGYCRCLRCWWIYHERLYSMAPKTTGIELCDNSYAGARISIHQSPVKRCFPDEHGSWVKVTRKTWNNALVKQQFANM